MVDIKDFMEIRLSGLELRVIIACVSLGIDADYKSISIRKDLTVATALKEKNISRVVASLKAKNIVQTRYVRKTREFFIRFNSIDNWKRSTKPKRLG